MVTSAIERHWTFRFSQVERPTDKEIFNEVNSYTYTEKQFTVTSESRWLGYPQSYTAFKLSESEQLAVSNAKKNDKAKKQTKKKSDEEEGVPENYEMNPLKRLYNELTIPLLFQTPHRDYECSVEIKSRD